MVIPTKKGTVKFIGNVKFVSKGSKKTGRNTYTTTWEQTPTTKRKR